MKHYSKSQHSSPLRLSIHNSKTKEKTTHFCVVFVAPLVGLEPTTTTRCGTLNFCSHCRATLQNSDRCRVLFAPFIRHRRRSQTNQLTARLLTSLSIHNSKTKEKTTHFCVVFVAPLVGLEPTTTTRCGALNFCSHCQATLQNSDRCRVLFAPFIRHRRRSQTNQLTARLLTSLSIHKSKTKKDHTFLCGLCGSPCWT